MPQIPSRLVTGREVQEALLSAPIASRKEYLDIYSIRIVQDKRMPSNKAVLLDTNGDVMRIFLMEDNEEDD